MCVGRSLILYLIHIIGANHIRKLQMTAIMMSRDPILLLRLFISFILVESSRISITVNSSTHPDFCPTQLRHARQIYKINTYGIYAPDKSPRVRVDVDNVLSMRHFMDFQSSLQKFTNGYNMNGPDRRDKFYQFIPSIWPISQNITVKNGRLPTTVVLRSAQLPY